MSGLGGATGLHPAYAAGNMGPITNGMGPVMDWSNPSAGGRPDAYAPEGRGLD